MRAKFIFEVPIVAQVFTKLTPPDRNNLITRVSDFLQPRLSLLIPIQQRSFSVTNGLMSIGHTWTPVPKSPKLLKDFILLSTEPVKFHIWYPRQKYLPPINSMSNIASRSTNLRQLLKGFNRLAVSHSVPPSRDDTYSIWFQKHRP